MSSEGNSIASDLPDGSRTPDQSKMSHMEASIRQLLDRMEIHDTLVRYCRGVDRMDGDLVLDVFHPDATDDHGVPRSPKEFLDAIKNAAGPHPSMHLTGNELIEFDDTGAWVESYFVSIQTLERADGRYTRSRGGRYVDRFERREGKWRIARRTVLDDWSRIDRVVETVMELAKPGQFAPHDLVYRLRSGRSD